MNNVKSIFLKVGDIVADNNGELFLITDTNNGALNIWVYNLVSHYSVMRNRNDFELKANTLWLYNDQMAAKDVIKEKVAENKALKVEIEHLKNDLEYVKDSRDLWKKLAQGDRSTGYDLLKAKLDYDAYEAKIYEDHRIKFSHDI